MNPTDTNTKCEICDKPASYRPQFNKALCLQHFKEHAAERGIHLFTTKNIENTALEMFKQYQIVLNKTQIIEIMKKSVDQSLTEMDSD